MKHFTLFSMALLFALAQTLTAQHSHDGHTRCGTMEYMEMLKQQDPTLETRMLQLEEMTQLWIQDNPTGSKDLFITIPVVVHVIWKTSVQNIPDDQIISQIDVLNEDYRRLNNDTTNTPLMFQDVAADTQIEFCLATTDPDGNPTNGITRTETTVTSFTQNNAMKFTSQGGHDAWPTDQYLNIWVCNLGGGLLGYAQFPNGPANTDGVVIGYPYFGYNSPGGYPYNLGRTTTHEVGHWLNLYHIWGDDGGACTGTDLVADTPNQGNNYWGCPPFPQSSCGSEDMYQNYMDYTDDDCMNIFTDGQKVRMQAAINFFRPELFESTGCVDDLPTAAFTANHTQIPTDCGVDFTDLSTGDPTGWYWYFEGGTPETSTEQHPTGIVYESAGSYLVSLEVENGSGTNLIEIDDFIMVGDEYLPEVDFMADQSAFCTDATILMTDMTTACPTAWEWTFEPGTVTFVNGTDPTSQHPEVTFDVPGVYSVTLKATNANGETTGTKEDYLFAGGQPLPFAEDFEDESETMEAWTIVNPDEVTTWEHTEAEGNEPGMYSMSIWFHEEFTVYEVDHLISPVLNLSGVQNAALSFRHAYAQHQQSLSDSLNIYVSDDCGNTWSKAFSIADDGSGNFATVDPSPDQFYPETSDDWCNAGDNAECIMVDLTPWANAPNVQVMFETVDFYGNTLYVDDVELIITTASSALADRGEVRISLYPIPADDYLHVDIRNVREYVDVEIHNVQGTVVRSTRMAAESASIRSGISTAGLGSGIYFVRLSNADFSRTEKVVVK